MLRLRSRSLHVRVRLCFGVEYNERCVLFMAINAFTYARCHRRCFMLQRLLALRHQRMQCILDVEAMHLCAGCAGCNHDNLCYDPCLGLWTHELVKGRNGCTGMLLASPALYITATAWPYPWSRHTIIHPVVTQSASCNNRYCW